MNGIRYQLITFSRWIREAYLRLLGVDRLFHCQCEEEYKSKCVKQCDHCKEYYSPIEKP